MGINRNIVECKCTSTATDAGFPGCINRNIVECKYGSFYDSVRDEGVLIETLWNVNFQWGVWVTAWARQVLIETLWNVNIKRPKIIPRS